MSDISQFFPSNSTTVSDLPVWGHTAANAQLKTTTNAKKDSTEAGYHTAVSATESTNKVAGTWYTVCDITGAGIFSGAYTPDDTGTSAEYYIEVTVDGTVSTCTVTVAANERLFMGGMLLAAVPVISFLASREDEGVNLNGFSDYGHAAKAYHYMPDALQAYNVGLPTVRFKTDLKVRVKGDQANTTASLKNAGAVYALTDA